MPKVSEFKWKDMEAEAEAATAAARERCTMPLAQSAERHVRFPSSPMAPGQFLAATATRSIDQPDHPEDTELGNHPIWGLLNKRGYFLGPAKQIFRKLFSNFLISSDVQLQAIFSHDYILIVLYRCHGINTLLDASVPACIEMS